MIITVMLVAKNTIQSELTEVFRTSLLHCRINTPGEQAEVLVDILQLITVEQDKYI